MTDTPDRSAAGALTSSEEKLEKIKKGEAKLDSLLPEGSAVPPPFTLQVADATLKGPQSADDREKTYLLTGTLRAEKPGDVFPYAPGKEEPVVRQLRLTVVSTLISPGRGNARRYVVLIDLLLKNENRPLSQIPWIGERIGGEITGGQLFAVTRPLDKDAIKKVNDYIKKYGPEPDKNEKPASVPKLTGRKGSEWASGLYVSAGCKIGEQKIPPVTFALRRKTKEGGAEPAEDAPAEPVTDAKVSTGSRIEVSARYLPEIPAEKSLQRVAVPAAVRVTMDTVVKQGPVEVSAIGAGVTLPFDKDADPLHFLPPLEGLSVNGETKGRKERADDGTRSGIAFAGAILIDTGAWRQGSWKFDGIVLVSTPKIDAQLAGSYAYVKPKNDPAFSSFFGFLNVRGLGLTFPPVTVNGFMGGGGFNSAVRVPTVDKAWTFPFLVGLDSGTVDGETKPHAILKKLCGTDSPNPWVTPKQGRSWGALGIDVMVKEAVQGRLLALLDWGGTEDFTAALIGMLTAELPRAPEGDKKKHKPYLSIELQVLAQYERASGQIAIATELTDKSYVVDDECKVTGGTAVYLWTRGEHAGEHVMSCGGYSPAFKKPDHYPKVPRISAILNIGEWMTYRLEGYLAGTSRALMLGGALSLASDSGWWRWWVSASIDIWHEWKPFWLRGDIGVSLGLAATLRKGPVKCNVSGEFGVTIGLWWAEDDQGQMHKGGSWSLHAWALDFDGSWGDPLPADKPAVSWTEFQRQSASPLQVGNKKSTRLRTRSSDDHDAPAASTVYDTGGFVFDTDAGAPVSTLRVNGAKWQPAHDPDHKDHQRIDDDPAMWDLVPMGKAGRGLRSEHTLTVTRTATAPSAGSPAADADVVREQGWRIYRVLSNHPTALFQRSGDNLPLNTDRNMERDVLTGLRVVASPRTSPAALEVPEANVATTPVKLKRHDVLPPAATAPSGPEARCADSRTRTRVSTSLKEKSAARTALMAELESLGITGFDHDRELTGLPDLVRDVWSDPPLVAAGA
jgi:hypothetical protein